MINGKIDAREVKVALGELSPKIKSKVKKVFSITAREWQSYVRSKYFTSYAYGKKSDKLQTRTGKLRGSVRPVPVKEFGGAIESGISFGSMYAPTHIGPKGKTTIIKPTNKKYLTIPLQAAMTARGEVRGRALDDSQWGNTFMKRSEKGHLIIYGQRLFQKGKRAGQASAKIVPLFILKKQVTVKTRIHPEEIFVWSKDRIVENINKEILEIK